MLNKYSWISEIKRKRKRERRGRECETTIGFHIRKGQLLCILQINAVRDKNKSNQ
jgi:hypothetical protein